MKSLRAGTRRSLFVSALVLSATLLSATSSFAQVKIGDNPGTVNANAVLDVESTTKGILFPRMSLTATTDPSPLTAHIAGMQVYNINNGVDVDPGIYYNDGTKWIRTGGDAEKTYEFGSGAPTGACTAGTMYVDTLESSPTAGQSWACVSGAWIVFTPAPTPATTPFYLAQSTSDAKGNKGSSVYRPGWVGLNTVSNPKAPLHMSGVFLLTRNGYSSAGIWKGTHAIGGIEGTHTAGGSTWFSIQNTGGTANLYLAKRGGPGAPEAYVRFYYNGANIAAILRTSGSSVSYNTTSDARLKENIKPTHYGILELMKIEVKDYNFISDKKTPNTGFIAQQLYQVFPMAVTVGGTDAKENPWSVDYAKVTPLLVKAIQDQQAEIASLKAQLAEKDASNMREVAAVNARLDAMQAKLAQLVAPSAKSATAGK